MRHMQDAFVFSAAALAVSGMLVAAGPASAGTTTLCTQTNGRFSVTRVASNSYYVMPNEWGSTAPLCVATDGGPDFTITQSDISQSSVGAYPDLSTIGSQNGLPAQISRMGDPKTSWSTLTPGPDSKYDVAYDLTIGTSATSTGWAGGAEVMIWLKSHGHPYPAGPLVASKVWIDGYAYDVHVKPNPGGTGHVVVTFVREEPTRSVSNLNLGQFVRKAAKYGSFPTSYYLLKVQAGFELWYGGTGIETTYFSYRPGTEGTAMP